MMHVKVCVTVDLSFGHIFSPFGGFWASKNHLTANILKMVSHSAICQLQLDISNTRAF